MCRLQRKSRPRLESLEARLAPATLIAGFTQTTLPGTISNGTAMEFSPTDLLFVLEQGGTCKVYACSGSTWVLQQSNFFADQLLSVNSSGERGLLGVAFDPNYASNHFVYFYHTTSTTPIHNRVIRVTANAAGDKALAGTQVTLLDLDNLSSATNHNGGSIHFGVDGKLYIAVGENANGANSQSSANLLGKMLRMNPDGSIPTDNPFYNTFTGQNRLIWAMGLRNPFTFTFRPNTSQMYINDVGEVTWEEINVGAAGANYGWNTTEGAFNQASFPQFTEPLLYYNHSNATANSTGSNYTGSAITGGAFYNPTNYKYPQAYVGDYFYADYVSSWIKRYDIATNTVTDFATSAGSVVDLKVGTDGALYFLARGSSIVGFATYTGTAPPYVVTDPANQSKAIGQSATFTVTAGGPGTLSYQWQRNGVNITGATSSSYTIPSVAASDNNTMYRVVLTNASGSAMSATATLSITGLPAPARVSSVVVNGGGAQRSMIRNLTVNFDSVVHYIGTPNDPFTLGAGAATVSGGTIDNSSGHSVINLTFTGSGMENNSLADGNYLLTIYGNWIQDNANRYLDGNNDGIAGGDSTTSFFRLFGDGTGDHHVDQVDYLLFRNAISTVNDQVFDFNNDAQVDQLDYLRFRDNLGI
ncbi:MAG: PQQ-dependent sugar dehydrogenase [Gemmataceae bacterium]